MTIQDEIDKLLKLIEDNQKLIGVPRILIQANSESYEQEPVVIPPEATELEKIVMETIEMVRKLERCPKCNPKEGGMQVLDWESGKWNCPLHKD